MHWVCEGAVRVHSAQILWYGVEQQTIPAGHLRVGDIVLCADGKHRIGEIEHGTQHVEVYQLFFQPDVAIETFYTMDPAILTSADWHKSQQAWQAARYAGKRTAFDSAATRRRRCTGLCLGCMHSLRGVGQKTAPLVCCPQITCGPTMQRGRRQLRE